MSHYQETDAEKPLGLLADRLPTRRDQFAMAALKGLLAGSAQFENPEAKRYLPGARPSHLIAAHVPSEAARVAVELADATIAALDGDG